MNQVLPANNLQIPATVTGEKPPDKSPLGEKLCSVSLGFRPEFPNFGN